MKKMRKALASLAIAGMVLSMAPASVFAADADRIEGKDRYATSVQIAEKAFASASTAIVAAGNPDNLVDSLAAAPLAAQEKAPIYLTNVKDKVDVEADLVASLNKLGVTKVFAVGAAGKDTATVEALKKAGFDVEVLAGNSRIETADAINAKLKDVKGTIVVGLKGEADAMSVASFAAANKYQIVIADGKGETKATDVDYIIGGPTMVKDIDGADRIYGNNRYETNEAVVKKLAFEYNTVYVANGASLADALAASVLAAQTKSPILLSNGTTVKAASYVNEKLKADSKVVALGGTGAVSAAALNSVKYQAPATLEVSSVTAINPMELQVKFNRAVDEDSALDLAHYVFTLNGTKYGVEYDPVTDLLAVDGSGDPIVDFNDDTKDTVTFRLKTALTNGAKYSIDVKAGVLAEDKASVVERYADSQKTFSDTAAPKLVKAEKTSGDLLKLTFDEPVVAGMTVTVDGTPVALENPSEEILTYTVVSDAPLAAALRKAGSHSVSVYGATDTAAPNANTASILTGSFTVGTDTEAPYVVEVKQVKNNSRAFDIVFSENVTLNHAKLEDNITIKKNGYTIPMATDESAPDWTVDYRDADKKLLGTQDGTKVRVARVTFEADTATMLNPLYDEDEDTVTLSITVQSYTDSVNLVGAKTTKSVTMTKDLGAPKVESIYDNYIKGTLDSAATDTDGRLVVVFDKDIKDLFASKISVTDKDGVYRTVKTATIVNGDEVEIELLNLDDRDKIEDKAPFKVTFEAGAVKSDAHSVANAAFTTTVNKSNSVVAPVVEAIPAGGVTVTGNVIKINFDYKMGTSAAVLANYTLDNAAMPAGTTISMSGDNKVVTITLPTGYANTAIKKLLTVSKDVKTSDGSAVVASVATKLPYSTMVDFVDTAKPELVAGYWLKDKASDKTSSTIRLQFSEAIDFTAGDYDDLKIVINGSEVKYTAIAAVSDDSIENDDRHLDITLDGTYNVTQSVTITTVAVGSKNASMGIVDKAGTPNKLKEGTTITVNTASTH